MRKDSKRLPGKHYRSLLGKPLYEWTFNQAKALDLPVIVSSDDLFLLGAAAGYGFRQILRPPEKVDTGKTNEIRDALEYIEHQTGERFDVIVDLDVTNPNRSVEDIEGAIKIAETLKVDLVVSVTESRRSPYFNQVELLPWGGGDYPGQVVPVIGTDFKRSQDAPHVYDLNCSIYCYGRDFLLSNRDHKSCLHAKKIIGYVMPPESFCDIDTELDLFLVSKLMEARNVATTDNP